MPGSVARDPVDLVRGFLDAMERRDLATASGFLAPGFRMTFPGDAVFESLEALVAWAKPRYRSVRKTYDGFDRAESGGDTVVYCFGTLSGEWPDGSAFAGIRFIDRFRLRDGELVEQQVWNDLAEHR